MENTVSQLAELLNRRFVRSKRYLPKDLRPESKVKKVEFIDLALNNWYIQMFADSEHSIEINLYKFHSHEDALAVAHARQRGDIDFFSVPFTIVKTFNVHKEYGAADKYQIAILVTEGEPRPRNLNLDDIVDFVESAFKSIDPNITPPATPA